MAKGRKVQGGRILSQGTVGVPFLMVGVWSAKCMECIICGFVEAVYKLEWAQGVWDDRVDVSYDQPFKAFYDYRCERYKVIVI